AASGGKAGDGAASMLDRLFAVYRANVLAARSYRPNPFPGRLALIRAGNPEKAALSTEDGLLGWTGLADRVDVEIVPGDHYGILDLHVGELGRAMERFLEDAPDPAPGPRPGVDLARRPTFNRP